MPAVTSAPNQRPRFKCTDHPTVLILFVEHLLSPLTFSLLCTHVQLGRDPLIYGKDPSFTLSPSLSLSTHCAFQTQKSSLGSQSESDRPQRRAFTSSYTHLFWLLPSSTFDISCSFLLSYCSVSVMAISENVPRSGLLCGSNWVVVAGFAWCFSFLGFFFFALVGGGFGDYEHVELYGSLWRGFGVCLILGSWVFCGHGVHWQVGREHGGVQ